jgi:hypothetical protein
MRDEHNRLAFRVADANKLELHDLPRLRIQRCEGLVHEQDIRADRKRTRNIYPLPHPSRELMRIVGFEAFEPDQVDELLRNLLRLAAGPVLNLQTE